MNPVDFDEIAKLFAARPSRRQVVRGLVSGGLATLVDGRAEAAHGACGNVGAPCFHDLHCCHPLHCHAGVCQLADACACIGEACHAAPRGCCHPLSCEGGTCTALPQPAPGCESCVDAGADCTQCPDRCCGSLMCTANGTCGIL